GFFSTTITSSPPRGNTPSNGVTPSLAPSRSRITALPAGVEITRIVTVPGAATCAGDAVEGAVVVAGVGAAAAAVVAGDAAGVVAGAAADAVVAGTAAGVVAALGWLPPPATLESPLPAATAADVGVLPPEPRVASTVPPTMIAATTTTAPPHAARLGVRG